MTEASSGSSSSSCERRSSVSSVVEEEVRSWRGFADALRGKDREAFVEMMSICRRYGVEIEAADRPVTSEAMFMAILMVQHKMIKWLQRQLSEY